MPTGELPQNMTLIVDRHLVGKISPGTRITAIGIYSIYQVHTADSAAASSQCVTSGMRIMGSAIDMTITAVPFYYTVVVRTSLSPALKPSS